MYTFPTKLAIPWGCLESCQIIFLGTFYYVYKDNFLYMLAKILERNFFSGGKHRYRRKGQLYCSKMRKGEEIHYDFNGFSYPHAMVVVEQPQLLNWKFRSRSTFLKASTCPYALLRNDYYIHLGIFQKFWNDVKFEHFSLLLGRSQLLMMGDRLSLGNYPSLSRWRFCVRSWCIREAARTWISD